MFSKHTFVVQESRILMFNVYMDSSIAEWSTGLRHPTTCHPRRLIFRKVVGIPIVWWRCELVRNRMGPWYLWRRGSSMGTIHPVRNNNHVAIKFKYYTLMLSERRRDFFFFFFYDMFSSTSTRNSYFSGSSNACTNVYIVRRLMRVNAERRVVNIDAWSSR